MINVLFYATRKTIDNDISMVECESQKKILVSMHASPASLQEYINIHIHNTSAYTRFTCFLMYNIIIRYKLLGNIKFTV